MLRAGGGRGPGPCPRGTPIPGRSPLGLGQPALLAEPLGPRGVAAGPALLVPGRYRQPPGDRADSLQARALGVQVARRQLPGVLRAAGSPRPTTTIPRSAPPCASAPSRPAPGRR